MNEAQELKSVPIDVGDEKLGACLLAQQHVLLRLTGVEIEKSPPAESEGTAGGSTLSSSGQELPSRESRQMHAA